MTHATTAHTEGELKEMMWQACWFGYQMGYGVEEMKPIDKRAARTHFDRWWNENFSDSSDESVQSRNTTSFDKYE